ncbi:MAG: TIGR03915 family putative DNA repair protein, partial [Oscillospiraceae bacterium]
MSELIYLYDGSFDGFLCCVYEAYTRRETVVAITAMDELLLFATRTVETDFAHARRVYRSLVKIAPRVGDLVRRALLTCLDDREYRTYLFLRKLYREGAPLLRRLTDETYAPLLTAIRHLEGEAELLRGLVRFSELGGVLGSEIQPKNRVLPLLRSHFCGRYPEERFFIYDRTHREALFYGAHQAKIVPLEDFQMSPPDETEAEYRLLWKRFYDTIAIRERTNPKCRLSRMPKRYWNTLTEFQGESYFKTGNSLADAASPSAPAGIS